MELKPGVILAGLDLRMRPALLAAERIWREHGRPEGVTVTSGLDGVHSAGSLHYYGLAVDFRIRYWLRPESREVAQELRSALVSNAGFDVILESDHIHVEFQPWKM